MFKQLKEFQKNKNEQYNARFASASLVTKRIMILALTLVMCFSIFEIISSKVLAANQGKNQDSLAIDMYGLSQAVATGTWQLGTVSHKYENATGTDCSSQIYYIKDGKKAYDLGSYETGKMDFGGFRIVNGKLIVVEIPETKEYSPNTAWGLAANLIGMYNNLSFGNLGDISSGPGVGQAVNEHSWDLDTVMSKYSLNNKTNETTDALIKYWVFGKSLTDVGILEYKTAANDTTSSLRPIIGYGTYASYILATTSDTIMVQCINLAASFDVIGIFEGSYINADQSTSNFVIKAISDSSFFKETLLPLYNGVKDLRWVLMAVFLIVLIAQLTLFKPLSSFTAAQSTRDNTIKFLTRFLIMFSGVPMLMMVYHMCLSVAISGGFTSDLGNSDPSTFDDPRYYAKQEVNSNNIARKLDGKSTHMTEEIMESYIMSTFVNMDLVIRNNFALHGIDPNDDNADVEITYVYDPALNQFVLKSEAKLSTLAYKLNGYNQNAPLDVSLFGKNVDGKALDSIGNYNIGAVYRGTYATNTNDPSDDTSQTSGEMIRSMLIDYADGTVIESTNISQLISDYNGTISDDIHNFMLTGTNNNVEETEGYYSSFVQTVHAQLTQWFAMSPNYVDDDITAIAGKDTSSVYYLTGKDDGNLYAYTGIYMGKGVDSRTSDAGSIIPLYSDMVHLRNGNEGMEIKWNTAIRQESTNGNISRATILTGTDSSTSTSTGSGTGTGTGTSTGSGKSRVQYEVKLTFDEQGANFSPLGYYNFLHTRFTDDGFTVFDPTKTANNATGMSIYKVSIVYNDLMEIVQVIYLNAVLVSFGLLGWIFGISTIANLLVEFFQLVPSLLKAMVGSTRGFAHACAVMLTMVFEILASIILYTSSVRFMDFMIKIVGGLVRAIGNGISPGSSAKEIIEMLACLIVSAILIWSCSLLIRFRKALVLWFTGVIKAAMNMMFKVLGFDVNITDSDVGNANNNKLALAGAGVMAAGALTSSGDLDNIVNDLSNSKLGEQVMGNMDNLDDTLGGAVQTAATGDFKGAGMMIATSATDDTFLDPLVTKGVNDLMTEQDADQAMEGTDDSIDGSTPNGINNDPTQRGHQGGSSQSHSQNGGAKTNDTTSFVDGNTEVNNGVTGDTNDTDTTDTKGDTDTKGAAGVTTQHTSNSDYATGYERTDNISSDAAKGESKAYIGEGSAKDLDGLGLQEGQHEDVQNAIASGASEDEVRQMISGYQADNFGSVANANAYLASTNGGVVSETFEMPNGGTVEINAGNQTYDTGSNTVVGQTTSNYASGGESIMTFTTQSPDSATPTVNTYHTSSYGGGVEQAMSSPYTGNVAPEYAYNSYATATQQAFVAQSGTYANNPTAGTHASNPTAGTAGTYASNPTAGTAGTYASNPTAGTYASNYTEDMWNNSSNNMIQDDAEFAYYNQYDGTNSYTQQGDTTSESGD